MSTRVLINGAEGRMGRTTVTAICRDDALKLVGRSSRNDNLKECIFLSKAEIVIDFTNASVVFENTKVIIEAGAHPVIGTSGLQSQQIKELQVECERKQLGGVIAPNFCMAAVLMMRFAEQAARLFPEVEIVETHHEKKLDAPSSTAIKTAEMIARGRRRPPILQKTQETLVGARGAYKEGVPIHSLRLPGFLAKQEVVFGHLGGNLIISQETIDRSAFMPGVLLACKKVTQLKKMVYGLENLL